MKKRVIAFLLVLAMVMALAAGCTAAPKPTATPSGGAKKLADLKIGFVYIGPVGDGGWTDAHEAGRQALIKAFPGIKTLIKENVPETAECENAIRDLIDQGCNVIFATSFGFQDSVENVAKKYPNVQFFHATGWKTAANFSQYDGRMYQARFLAGIAAGKKSKNGKIGYIGAFPIPEVVSGINAYALGAKLANPKATVEVKWTNSWIDPAAARLSAEELLNSGCDVIGYQQDFTTPLVAAANKKAFATGNNISSKGVADTAYLTAPLFHWGIYYVKVISKMLDGTFVGGQSYWGSIGEGMVSLDPLSSVCAAGTQELVDEYLAKMTSGTWDVFTGEIKDQAGKVRVAKGAMLTDADIRSMDWFVQNVKGKLK